MSEQQHIYAILRTSADWDAVVAGDPAAWFYDKNGTFRVEPEVLASRAEPNVWTISGWDKPPRAYPGYAIRRLKPPPPPPPSVIKRERKRRRVTDMPRVSRVFTLPVEAPEQIDCLCEAYRLRPSQVVARLIAEAYRRDVVESGLLASLLADDTVIAPHD